jgi:hypothetical protein
MRFSCAASISPLRDKLVENKKEYFKIRFIKSFIGALRYTIGEKIFVKDIKTGLTTIFQ